MARKAGVVLVLALAAALFGVGESQAVGVPCVENCSENFGATLSTEQTATPETWYQPSTSSGAKNVHGIRILDTWSADPGKNMFVGGGFSPGAAETANSLIAVQFDLDFARTGVNANFLDPDSSDNTALPNSHWSATSVPAFFNTSWTKSGDAAGTINNAEESVQFMLPSEGDISYYRIRSKIVDKDTTTFGTNLLTGCGTCNYSGTFTGTGFEPNKAADGSALTSWKTGNQSGTQAYWQVDFGAGNAQAVRRIQLSYPAGSSNIPNTKGGVRLLASNNGTDWTHIVSQPASITQVDNLYVPSFGSLGSSVRYIRIEVIGNSVTGEAELSEITMSAATTQNDLRVNHRFKQSKPKVTRLQLGAQTLEGSTSTATSTQTLTGKIGYEHKPTGDFVRQNEFYNLNSTADQMMTSSLDSRFVATGTCPVGTNQQCAQKFVPTQSTIKAVKFWARSATSPLSGLRVEIRTTSAGLPTSTVIGSAVVTAASLSPADYREVFATFTSPLSLTPGTTYAIVLMPDAASNTNDYLVAQAAGNFYASEDSATYNGTSWTKKPNADIGFITYSAIATENATIKLIDKSGTVVATNSATVNIDGTFNGSINLPIGMSVGKGRIVVEYSHGADTASLNQLANSSFETGTTIADNWLANASSSQSVQTYGEAGLSAPVANDGIQWGTKVQRIVANGTSAGVRQKNLLLWDSERASGSGYVYTPTGQTGRTAQVCFSFDNDANYSRCGSNVSLSAGGWTRVEHSTFLNTSTSSVLNDPVGIAIIVTNSISGDTYYFDGAQLARVGDLTNASMEFYENGELGFDGWEWAGLYCYASGSQPGPSTDNVDSGRYSCRSGWDTESDQFLQTTSTNHAGVRHKATIKMFTAASGVSGKIYSDATNQAGCGFVGLTTNVWNTVTCEFTPSSPTFSLKISDKVGVVYKDSITLEVCLNNICSEPNQKREYMPAGEGREFTVQDTTPPSTPGTPTTPNPTNDSTPTWTWTASSDAYGIDRYDVCWDTVAGGCANSSTSTTNSFTHSTALADGTWYFKVRTVDGNGVASVYSGNGQTLVDATNPTTPGTPSTTTPTSDTTPSWSWTASTDGGSGLNNYQLCWDTVAGGCANSSTSTTNNFTHSTALAQGTWYFKVRAADVAGNLSPYSGNGQVLVDTTAPTTPGTPSTTTPTFDTTPVWNWTASTDGGSGLRATNAYEVQWCTDPAFSGCSSNTDFSNTNSYTHVFGLSVGTWYFRTRAFDGAGNASAFSPNGSVVIQASSDTTPPSVPGTPSTTSPTADNTPAWTWTASTDNVGVDHYMVCWDTTAGGCTNVDTSSSNSYTHSAALTDGTWYIKVRAVDQAGNSSAYSGNASVVVDATGPTTPGTPATTTPTADTTPTWTWTASTDSGVGLNNYQLCWDTVAGGCANSANIGTNSFTHSTALAQGTWYMKVRAMDTLGNLSAYSANGSVVIDTTAPSTPGTPSTASPTEDTTPTWTWTASTDGGSGLRPSNTYEVMWCSNSGFTANCGSAFSNTNSYTHTANLGLGTWYIRVRAYDAVDNASAWSGTGSALVEDVTAPSVPGTPSTTTPTADTTPTWTWSASTDSSSGVDHYELCWDTTSGGCTYSATSTTNGFTHSTALAVGTWYFKVRAVDVAGNASAYSAVGSVVIEAPPSSGGGQPAPAKKKPAPAAAADPAETAAEEPSEKPTEEPAPAKPTEKKPASQAPEPETGILVMAMEILSNPWMILALLMLAGAMILRRRVRRLGE